MVINEAMRLYPPVWCLRRQAIHDDNLMGYHVPRGHNVMLSQWLVHRNPAFWPNPHAFMPERFSARSEQAIPRYAFFPFGGGPRVCIASQFALTEAQLILACIAQQYHVRIVKDHPIVPQPLVTLRARHGINVSLERRCRTLRH
jgi:cytochrome P450